MKPMYAVGAVVLVVLVGAGIWMSSNSSSSMSTATTTGSTVSGAEKSSGSLASLVARGGSWTCAVNHSSNNDSTTGTVFISGNKIRGDFDSKLASAGAIQSHMISDSQYVYVWSNQMQAGMKMKATPANDGGSQTSGGQYDYYNQNYDYDCSPWNEDPAKFMLPVGVTFSEMTIPSASASGSANVQSGMPAGLNCSMCDQAPTAEAKAACKTALKCQ